MSEQIGASVTYDLGRGVILNAYSIDPKISSPELIGLLRQADKPTNLDLEAIARDTIFKAKVGSIEELEITFSGTQFKLPEVLQPYRDKIGEINDAKEGWYNGKVMIAEWEVDIPLKVSQGGFYDFTASKLEDDPSKILPGKYVEGMTIEDHLNSEGVDLEKRAKYVGCAYNLATKDGQELCVVQRAKGLAIAADCIALPGSTPNPNFSEEGFNINDYMNKHVGDEMKEEFNLRNERVKLFNSIPFFDVDGWDRTRIADEIAKQDREFVKRLKEELHKYNSVQ